MPTLYITEPGATVRLRSESLEVTVPEEALEDAGNGEPASIPPRQVELHRLELVALVGRAHITSEAMLACLDRGVAVAFFRRDGRFRGRLCPGSDRCGDLRARPRPTSEGIETILYRARAQECDHQEPDPAPPPRGLKLKSGRDYHEFLAVGARPRPTSEGIETTGSGASLTGITGSSPTPPHLRGD